MLGTRRATWMHGYRIHISETTNNRFLTYHLSVSLHGTFITLFLGTLSPRALFEPAAPPTVGYLDRRVGTAAS